MTAKIENNDFPSILEQLEQKNSIRKEIDKLFLKILGYKGDYDKLLNTLYEDLSCEIISLKQIMKEK